jgi:hypothetical protein
MELQNKKFVYHRALNSKLAFENFLQKNAASNYTLAAEGDICWAYIDGEFVIYIHHPDVQGKSLSNEHIKELLAKDELFTLEKLLSINSDVHFIFELKTGNGDLDAFLAVFRASLEHFDVQNAIVDAFSLEQLKALKKAMPHIKTSLHTKFLFGNYVLESTFERPYLRVHKIAEMDSVDYFTLSFTTTHVNFLGLDIDTSYKEIYKAEKKLNLGAIKNMVAFKRAVESNAEYIYLRSSEVLENYEQFLDLL